MATSAVPKDAEVIDLTTDTPPGSPIDAPRNPAPPSMAPAIDPIGGATGLNPQGSTTPLVGSPNHHSPSPPLESGSSYPSVLVNSPVTPTTAPQLSPHGNPTLDQASGGTVLAVVDANLHVPAVPVGSASDVPPTSASSPQPLIAAAITTPMVADNTTSQASGPVNNTPNTLNTPMAVQGPFVQASVAGSSGSAGTNGAVGNNSLPAPHNGTPTVAGSMGGTPVNPNMLGHAHGHVSGNGRAAASVANRARGNQGTAGARGSHMVPATPLSITRPGGTLGGEAHVPGDSHKITKNRIKVRGNKLHGLCRFDMAGTRTRAALGAHHSHTDRFEATFRHKAPRSKQFFNASLNLGVVSNIGDGEGEDLLTRVVKVTDVLQYYMDDGQAAVRDARSGSADGTERPMTAAEKERQKAGMLAGDLRGHSNSAEGFGIFVAKLYDTRMEHAITDPKSANNAAKTFGKLFNVGQDLKKILEDL